MLIFNTHSFDLLVFVKHCNLRNGVIFSFWKFWAVIPGTSSLSTNTYSFLLTADLRSTTRCLINIKNTLQIQLFILIFEVPKEKYILELKYHFSFYFHPLGEFLSAYRSQRIVLSQSLKLIYLHHRDIQLLFKHNNYCKSASLLSLFWNEKISLTSKPKSSQ